jgi:hypothetical protein
MLIYFPKTEQGICLVSNTLYDCYNKQNRPNRYANLIIGYGLEFRALNGLILEAYL